MRSATSSSKASAGRGLDAAPTGCTAAPARRPRRTCDARGAQHPWSPGCWAFHVQRGACARLIAQLQRGRQLVERRDRARDGALGRRVRARLAQHLREARLQQLGGLAGVLHARRAARAVRQLERRALRRRAPLSQPPGVARGGTSPRATAVAGDDCPTSTFCASSEAVAVAATRAFSSSRLRWRWHDGPAAPAAFAAAPGERGECAAAEQAAGRACPSGRAPCSSSFAAALKRCCSCSVLLYLHAGER